MTTDIITKQRRDFYKRYNALPREMRFNRGYQDGYLGAMRGWPNRWATEKHFCELYRQGWLSGYADASKGNPRDPETAWYFALLWGDIEG